MAALKNKYNNYSSELKAVREYLSKNVATQTMVSAALDIYRPNLCRYKRKLQKQGILNEVYKGICRESGYKATYLSCKPIGGKGDTQ